MAPSGRDFARLLEDFADVDFVRPFGDAGFFAALERLVVRDAPVPLRAVADLLPRVLALFGLLLPVVPLDFEAVVPERFFAPGPSDRCQPSVLFLKLSAVHYPKPPRPTRFRCTGSAPRPDQAGAGLRSGTPASRAITASGSAPSARSVRTAAESPSASAVRSSSSGVTRLVPRARASCAAAASS